MVKKKKRIFVVDDHPALRAGLRAIFAQWPDLTICGEAKNAGQALARVKRLNPDVALVDISLRDGVDGLELTRRLRALAPALPVLVFSLHEEYAYRDAARAAGARGYCTKGVSNATLVKAVRQVLRGESLFKQVPR